MSVDLRVNHSRKIADCQPPGEQIWRASRTYLFPQKLGATSGSVRRNVTKCNKHRPSKKLLKNNDLRAFLILDFFVNMV